MGLNNFPVDLVLLGMIAAFLVLRLRSVLGKRSGFEGGRTILPKTGAFAPLGRVSNLRADAARTEAQTDQAHPRTLPDSQSPAGQALGRIKAIDSQFNPARFLDGAETAFRLIVLAFAKGDRAALQPLLTPALMDVFDRAISERETTQLTQHTTLHGIRSAEFDRVVVNGSVADVSVRFVSDQVSYTNDAKGLTVVGTEAVTEITDIWSFERDLTSRDPAWRLAAAQSA